MEVPEPEHWFTSDEIAAVTHMAKAWETMEVSVTNPGDPRDVDTGRFMQTMCDHTAQTLRRIVRKMEAFSDQYTTPILEDE